MKWPWSKPYDPERAAIQARQREAMADPLARDLQRIAAKYEISGFVLLKLDPDKIIPHEDGTHDHVVAVSIHTFGPVLEPEPLGEILVRTGESLTNGNTLHFERFA